MFLHQGQRNLLYRGVVKVVEDYNKWVTSDPRAQESGYVAVDISRIYTKEDFEKVLDIMRPERVQEREFCEPED